ncbi:hypothetical protein HSX11_25235 [Oxalobacteraceae bacterium]|nr:hypothetical protein [Oxalobacteraceae bacterium]
MEITTLVLLLMLPLLVWRIYSRLKKLMGRNPSTLWHHYAAAVLLPLALGVLAAQLLGSPLGLLALLLGAGAGAGLGWWNMKLSRLENTREGFFYTPNLQLGMLVSLLFIGRLLYRGFELYLQMHEGTPLPPGEFHQSPLTVLPFAALAAFYACYHLLLLRWRRGQKPLAPLPQP